MQLRASKVTEEVGQTDMEWHVPLKDIMTITGTWTPTIASNVIDLVHTAADAAFDLVVPITPPGARDETSRGAEIESVTVAYVVGTAAMDDAPAPTFYKQTVPVEGTLAVAVTAGGTWTFSLTTTSRKTVDEHTLVCTPGTPAFIATGEAWYMHLIAWDGATTTAFKIEDVLVKYTRRL